MEGSRTGWRTPEKNWRGDVHLPSRRGLNTKKGPPARGCRTWAIRRRTFLKYCSTRQLFPGGFLAGTFWSRGRNPPGQKNDTVELYVRVPVAWVLPLDPCCGCPFDPPISQPSALRDPRGGARNGAVFPTGSVPKIIVGMGAYPGPGAACLFFREPPGGRVQCATPFTRPLPSLSPLLLELKRIKNIAQKKISSVRPEYLYTPSLPSNLFRARAYTKHLKHTRTHTQKLFAHLTLPAPLPPSEQGRFASRARAGRRTPLTRPCRQQKVCLYGYGPRLLAHKHPVKKSISQDLCRGVPSPRALPSKVPVWEFWRGVDPDCNHFCPKRRTFPPELRSERAVPRAPGGVAI